MKYFKVIFVLLLLSSCAQSVEERVKNMKEPANFEQYSENIKTLLIYQADVFRDTLSGIIAVKKSSSNFQDYLAKKAPIDKDLYDKNVLFNQKNLEQMQYANKNFKQEQLTSLTKNLRDYYEKSGQIIKLFSEFNVNASNFNDPKFDNIKIPEK